jgi:hypothetical protein
MNCDVLALGRKIAVPGLVHISTYLHDFATIGGQKNDSRPARVESRCNDSHVP